VRSCTTWQYTCNESRGATIMHVWSNEKHWWFTHYVQYLYMYLNVSFLTWQGMLTISLQKTYYRLPSLYFLKFIFTRCSRFYCRKTISLKSMYDNSILLSCLAVKTFTSGFYYLPVGILYIYKWVFRMYAVECDNIYKWHWVNLKVTFAGNKVLNLLRNIQILLV